MKTINSIFVHPHFSKFSIQFITFYDIILWQHLCFCTAESTVHHLFYGPWQTHVWYVAISPSHTVQGLLKPSKRPFRGLQKLKSVCWSPPSTHSVHMPAHNSSMFSRLLTDSQFTYLLECWIISFPSPWRARLMAEADAAPLTLIPELSHVTAVMDVSCYLLTLLIVNLLEVGCVICSVTLWKEDYLEKMKLLFLHWPASSGR